MLIFIHCIAITHHVHANMCADSLAKVEFKGWIVIVDAYSSGHRLAGKFHSLGYKTIHVASKTNPDAYFLESFRPTDFDEKFTVTNQKEADRFIQQMNERGITPLAVLPGAEPGVAMADYLGALFKLPNANSLEHTVARFNKHDLYLRLKEASVPVGDFLSSDRLEALIGFFRHQTQKKVILKPLEGAGSINTYICRTEEEVATAFSKIQESRTGRASIQTQVLIQEFLQGDEYAVNFVSSNGRHVLTDIWQYVRDEIPGAGTAYGADILIPANGDVQQKLREYAEMVLNAVGLKYGASHLEIKMTPKGPIVLDVGARLCGADLPHLASQATHRDITNLVAKAYVNDPSFMKEPKDYQIFQQRIVVFLRSSQDGKRLRSGVVERLSSLPGVTAVRLNYKTGASLKRTIDSDTVVGTVELSGDNLENLLATMKHIRTMEENGDFEE